MPRPPVALGAVSFKVVISLLFIHCLSLLSLGVFVYWYLVLWCGAWCPIYSNNHLAEEEIAGRFTLIVLYLSVFCVSSLWCHELVCSL